MPFNINFNFNINRRQLLKHSIGASLIGSVMPMPKHRRAYGEEGQDPHFFLHLCISGGVDASYFFDARPLVLTDKGLHSNFTYKNADGPTLEDATPVIHTGSNGQSTLRSPLTNPLESHLSDLTIVNGIHMSRLDGHGSNMYYLFSNSAAPADSFMPLIGSNVPTPLQHVHLGDFGGDGNMAPTNFHSSTRLNSDQGLGLSGELLGARRTAFSDPLMDKIRGRLVTNSQGQGKFSLGTANLLSAFDRSYPLAKALDVATEEQGSDLDISSPLNIAMAYFRGGVTNSVTITLDRDPIIDTHDYFFGAKDTVSLYQDLVANIEWLLSSLKQTEWKNGQSYLDVTTVMISSEFSRTTRQLNMDIDSTGTDHNPLTNTMMFAGKGIKKGLVLGSSDLTEADDANAYTNVSPAHTAMDSDLIKVMGKPFDFATGQSSNVLPDQYDELQYITAPRIANTVMSMFGVDEEKYFRQKGERVKPLSHLLI